MAQTGRQESQDKATGPYKPKAGTQTAAFMRYLQDVTPDGRCRLSDSEIFDAVLAEGLNCPEYHRYWYPQFYREYLTKKGVQVGGPNNPANFEEIKAAHREANKETLASQKKLHKLKKGSVKVKEKDLVTILTALAGESPEIIAGAIMRRIKGIDLTETPAAQDLGDLPTGISEATPMMDPRMATQTIATGKF